MTARGNTPKSAIARHHAEWLSLVEVSGPFLSLPVLMKAFEQGLDPDDPDHVAQLRVAHDEWLEDRDDAIHTTWIDWVLRETLELPDEILRRAGNLDGDWNVAIKEQQETLRPGCGLITMSSTVFQHRKKILHPLPALCGIAGGFTDFQKKWEHIYGG